MGDNQGEGRPLAREAGHLEAPGRTVLAPTEAVLPPCEGPRSLTLVLLEGLSSRLAKPQAVASDD